MKEPSKEERKRLLIEMMKEDEKNGMYEKSDNELIAEFMGVLNVFVNSRFGAYQADDEQGSIDWVEGIRTLDYHRDWNLLMPVVEAIEGVEEPHPSNNPMKGTVWLYQVDILSRQRVEIYDHIEERSIVTVDEYGLTKIQSVYKAVVEFIKWYNNSQQHERK